MYQKQILIATCVFENYIKFERPTYIFLDLVDHQILRIDCLWKWSKNVSQSDEVVVLSTHMCTSDNNVTLLYLPIS